MKDIRRVVYCKQGNQWVPDQYIEDDPGEVYRKLARDMVAKKLHQCTYIKSIKDACNCDGTRDITITYDNNVRAVYTVED
ncbi:MAG: hypothetical protein K5637_01800 [Lachnospiraceae bacterium]|nr:hypothetical protein [Lachnospiraceae bacterium]